MLAGAAGLPLFPMAAEAIRPLERRIFVFEPQKAVGEIVSLILERRFGVEIDFVHEGAERARSLVERHPQAYGAVFWGHEPKLRPAEIWSPFRANELRYPFSVRQLVSNVEAVTGWAGTDRRLRR
ncbi:MAG: hypothetical protein ACK4P2_02325 [Hyphomonas sp.]